MTEHDLLIRRVKNLTYFLKAIQKRTLRGAVRPVSDEQAAQAHARELPSAQELARSEHVPAHFASLHGKDGEIQQVWTPEGHPFFSKNVDEHGGHIEEAVSQLAQHVGVNVPRVRLVPGSGDQSHRVILDWKHKLVDAGDDPARFEEAVKSNPRAADKHAAFDFLIHRGIDGHARNYATEEDAEGVPQIMGLDHEKAGHAQPVKDQDLHTIVSNFIGNHLTKVIHKVHGFKHAFDREAIHEVATKGEQAIDHIMAGRGPMEVEATHLKERAHILKQWAAHPNPTVSALFDIINKHQED